MRLPRRDRPTSQAAARYASAALPAGRTPWREAPLAVVDVEATGLDPARDEILAAAVVPIDSGRIIAGAIHELIVRPLRLPPAETVIVHGLRPADLAAAPPLEAVLDGLLDALAGRVLVAHAAWVERGLLGAALAHRGVALRGPIIDTAVLWRLHEVEHGRPDPGYQGLTALAQGLGLPVHRPHHATGDALTTAQVLLALATRLERARGGLTLRGASVGAERSLRAHSRFHPDR